MASSYLKNLITTQVPTLNSYYRIIFNLVSSLLLLPVVYYYYQSPVEYLFAAKGIYQIAGSILVIAGIYIVIDGFKNYGTDEFLGTYQIKNHHDFHPTKLNRGGWNEIVRHPLYFGGIILVIGLILIIPTVKLGVTNLLVIGYLYIGTLWEEKKLKSEFGEAYNDYRREVSMLIPFKWVLNKIRIR